MVVSSDHMHSRSSDKIPHKVYQVPFERGYLEDMITKTAQKESMLKLFSKVFKYVQTSWDSLLKSKELIDDLRDADLIVYEGMAFAAVLVSELHKIPRVSVFPGIPRPGFFHMLPYLCLMFPCLSLASHPKCHFCSMSRISEPTWH